MEAMVFALHHQDHMQSFVVVIQVAICTNFSHPENPGKIFIPSEL